MIIVLQFVNLKNLNTSLQVGDAVYARPTTQPSSLALQATVSAANGLVGILRKIENPTEGTYNLFIDNAPEYPPNSGITLNTVTPTTGDFIMFSKYNQSNGDIKGYYAEVKFVNNSTTKAELFSVGSEVTESSK